MKYSLCFLILVLILAASCSAATEPPATVLSGAYDAVSINGNPLPVRLATSIGDARQEIIADRFWVGGSAGRNAVMWRTVTRTTTDSSVKIDSTTATGTFEATLATAQTTFGPISASGNSLTLRARDGTLRIYARQH